ncbi:MAG TPA: VWA domain-containing protein [Pyrinomonadaceae bacterium]|jgi:Ca-activated chloride channel family protein
MKKAFRALPLLLALWAAAPACARQGDTSHAPPQDAGGEEVVRVSTALVTVPVSVTDRQGRFIPDLRREDFRIYEDGAEQEVAFFETADKPFTVALLLDTSDSTRLKLAQIQDAAVAFLGQLRPADRVIVIAFDRNVNLLCEATADHARAAAAVRRAQTGGGTSLYDAVAAATGRRLKAVAGRKAVVLFTDGVDTSSRRATFEGTLREAEELDALVYTIQYRTDDDVAAGPAVAQGQTGGQIVTAKGEPLEAAYKRAGLYLRLLADHTGGRSFSAGSPRLLAGVFGQIAEELRRQYSLGYYPANRSADGKRRRLKVRVGRPDAAVRARGGYVYQPEGGARER